jgi:DNA-directed RNA polymerase specialized sigma24 family protein
VLMRCHRRPPAVGSCEGRRARQGRGDTAEIFFTSCPRAPVSPAYTERQRADEDRLRFVDIAALVASPNRLARALQGLSEADLVRLKRIAQLRARQLIGVQWSDLLHEAVLRALEGTRRWPEQVPVVVFLAGIMRSLADEHWRQHRMRAALFAAPDTDTADAAPDPEREAIARSALVALDRLFRGDEDALKLITGLSHGLTAEEIQQAYGMDATRYATTRRRIRRAILTKFPDGDWR